MPGMTTYKEDGDMAKKDEGVTEGVTKERSKSIPEGQPPANLDPDAVVCVLCDNEAKLEYGDPPKPLCKEHAAARGFVEAEGKSISVAPGERAPLSEYVSDEKTGNVPLEVETNVQDLPDDKKPEDNDRA